jgi:two-component system phosphate regulon sensor histidine kinase PhoR
MVTDMKKKINRQLMFLSSLAIAITLMLMAAVFHRIFQAQVMDDLRIYAYALADGRPEAPGKGDYGYIDRYHHGNEKVRATVITPEGEVLYDSNADVGDMDNHAERPEVAAAIRYGEGSCIRQSATMGRNTYYFTVLLADGNILRAARESHSIWSILYRSLPAAAAAVCAVLVLCLILSRCLTASLVVPIGQITADIEHINGKDVYEELAPFAETIRMQHEAIVRNADMRQEFSANVSHELKTPLTAISGYSELIENGMAAGEDAVRFASKIRKSANRLLMLIDDTIRLSELDAQNRKIVFEKTDLYEAAKGSAGMLQFRADERAVELQIEGSSCIVQGDRQMIEEVVYNLCDNAISYNNPGGSVRVSVGYVDGKPTLKVKDTGIGIPHECQDRIFERFYRVDRSRSKSTGGTGLGLAIVKHIVSVHHADLSLVSEPGKGTEITVVFCKMPSLDQRIYCAGPDNK